MADDNQEADITAEGSRALLLRRRNDPTAVPRQRWAIIIGISQYQHADLNLRYAHHDAEALYELIRTPRGGGFDEERIVKLIDEKATTDNITRALRSFLKKPAREDIVLIYLACHGAPDPDRPQNVYLITHDTDPADIAGTAVPMEHIHDAVQPRNLYAERVVLIADTCHSAALGGAGRRSGIGETAAANRYLQSLSESKPTMAILTSAEVNETSREDLQWGGGHGVFTHHLLEGLRGKADNNTGVVTVGALFDYVREQVRKDTGDQQHPVIGSTAFDRNLALVITGDISANDYLLLGRNLLQLGWLLDDKQRFESASRYLQEALRFAGDLGQPLPEAHLYLGQAQLAIDQTDIALRHLKQAVEGLDSEMQVVARFYQIMAQATKGDLHAIVAEVNDFLTAHANDWRAAWLQGLAKALKSTWQPSLGRALLIGVGQYANPQMPSLRGPANDIALAEALLIEHFSFDPNQIIRLQDKKATRQAILAALKTLHTAAQPSDTVVIWFSGHAINQQSPAYLLPFDYDGTTGQQSISADELHQHLLDIPAAHKVVVLDTHVQQRLLDLVGQDNGYTLCLAENGPAGQAQELPIEGHIYGLFSYEMIQALKRQPKATLEDIEQAVTQAIEERVASRQVPLFIGNKARPLIGESDWQLYVDAFRTAQRQNYAALTLAELQVMEKRFSPLMTTPYPPLFHSLGRGYIEKDAFAQALATLNNARMQAKKIGYVEPALLLSLTVAQLRYQRYTDALSTLQEFVGLATDQAPALAEAVAVVARLSTRRLHALLVGVSKQQAAGLPAAQGALNDVAGIKQLLTEHLGADETNIVTLTNQKATASAINKAFAELLVKAQDEPAFFYFAGNGSMTSDGQPTILPYDARQMPIPNDILLSQLAEQARSTATNLATIIDAAWAPGDALPWGAPPHNRFVAADIRSRPATRAFKLNDEAVRGQSGDTKASHDWQPDPEWEHTRQRSMQAAQLLRIGRSTIYPSSIQAALIKEGLPRGVAVAEAEFPSPFDGKAVKTRGVLTTGLIQAMLEILSGATTEADQPPRLSTPTGLNSKASAVAIEGERVITYEGLIQGVAPKLKWLQPLFVGIQPTERLFSNIVQEEQVQATIRRQIIDEPLRQTEELLKRLLDRRNGEDPEAWLNLGIVYAGQNSYVKSIAALEQAIEQKEAGPPELCHQARYHLGRVLTLSAALPTPSAPPVGYGEARPGDLDRAVSELRHAIKGAPDNAAAYYYLGLAIRTRVEQEQLVEVEQAWNRYLALGAPHGQRDAVRDFLASLRSSRLGTGSGFAAGPLQLLPLPAEAGPLTGGTGGG